MAASRLLTLGVIFVVISWAVSAPVEDNDECGVSHFLDDHVGERIINGTEVPQGKYPWLAFMPYPGCTATIVSRKYILTAGHCVCNVRGRHPKPKPCKPYDTNSLTVVVGSVNKQKGQEFKVKRSFHHEKFLHPSKHDRASLHDIGLLELEEPLNFTENVRREGDPKKKVVITGWGDVGEEIYPDVLREGLARVEDDKICQHECYGDYDSDMICIESQNHTMAYHGDSGGPALVKENGRWTKIGICSYGKGRVTFAFPNVYARVSYFCDWIAEKTNNEVKCDN